MSSSFTFVPLKLSYLLNLNQIEALKGARGRE